MQDLKIATIQSALHWQNIDANLAMFEEKIWQINESVDIIILPEMFTTGFTMNASLLAEPMNSKTFRWMKQIAAQTKAVVTGSYIVREKEGFFNRLLWMEPSGTYDYYDKRHLFRMADEHKTYSSSKRKIVKEIKGWRIMPLICYDLRFPIWSRQGKGLSYDCLIYVANWPAKRSLAWNTLLRARAIENLAYVIGVNRVGEDENNILYSGDTSLVHPNGELLYSKNNEEEINIQTLSYTSLKNFREAFPAFLDADDFNIVI